MPVTSNPTVTAGAAQAEAATQSGRQTISLGRQILHLFSLAALGFASYLLITHFFLQSVQVVGVSMSPTLLDSGHYILNRWILHVRNPQPADVVVLRDPVDNGYSVKRIIAQEGDTILLTGDGRVYLNGRALTEPYLRYGVPTYPYGRAKEQTFTCGRGEYFVLGDNRMNSADSRTYGAIPRRNILGLLVH